MIFIRDLHFTLPGILQSSFTTGKFNSKWTDSFRASWACRIIDWQHSNGRASRRRRIFSLQMACLHTKTLAITFDHYFRNHKIMAQIPSDTPFRNQTDFVLTSNLRVRLRTGNAIKSFSLCEACLLAMTCFNGRMRALCPCIIPERECLYSS
jgi:hypothetical protein